MSADRKAILKELARREKAKELEASKPKFTIEEHCFDKQISFIRDPAKFKTAVCSRRSGKTYSCAADLIDTCLAFAGINALYVTLTRGMARRIIWKDLLLIINHYEIPCKIDNKDLTLTFKNGSTIHLAGADDEAEIQKFRGMHFKKVYIDEAQSFRSYIGTLVDDIIVPTLYDYNGSLCVIGTPGPVLAGYFYNIAHPKGEMSKGWSTHHWTILDNPFMKIKSGMEQSEILRLERERRGITEDDPTYQRESLGLWVSDTKALVFKFNQNVNLFEKPPDGKMEYIVGVDIGWEDADAIAVLGYSYEDKNVYLVREIVTTKQTITDLTNQLKAIRDEYKPVRMVMDAGALGKKIQEEILQRHGVFMLAAEKHRKTEFIALMNDDLRTGKFKAQKGSRFEEDCRLLQWDYSEPARPRISNSYHSDIADAALYAWRECKHYLFAPKEIHPKRGTDAYMDRLEAEEAQKVEERKNTKWHDPDQEDLEATVGDIFDDWDDSF